MSKLESSNQIRSSNVENPGAPAKKFETATESRVTRLRRWAVLILLHGAALFAVLCLRAKTEIDSLLDVRIQIFGRLIIPRGDHIDMRPLGGYHPMTSYQMRGRVVTESCSLYLLLWFSVCVARLLAIAAQNRAAAVRRLSGRCPSCGYDLRATPKRCPECGTVVRHQRVVPLMKLQQP